MKIVFLDIDGVLCTGETVKTHVNVEGHNFNPFHKPAVAELNRVLRETGARIVVSSSWRCDGPQWDALLFHFTQQGVEQRPIDRTPDSAWKSDGGLWAIRQRGDEIRAWLDSNAGVTDFVVIDDNRDMDAVKANFVWVQDGMFKGGFGPSHADQAIAVLRGLRII